MADKLGRLRRLNPHRPTVSLLGSLVRHARPALPVPTGHTPAKASVLPERGGARRRGAFPPLTRAIRRAGGDRACIPDQLTVMSYAGMIWASARRPSISISCSVFDSTTTDSSRCHDRRQSGHGMCLRDPKEPYRTPLRTGLCLSCHSQRASG